MKRDLEVARRRRQEANTKKEERQAEEENKKSAASGKWAGIAADRARLLRATKVGRGCVDVESSVCVELDVRQHGVICYWHSSSIIPQRHGEKIDQNSRQRHEASL